MKIDILAIAAHPDDAELSCMGTLLQQKALGNKVGIVDLTRGELGTRGTAEIRDQEAANASEIAGLDVRSNLALPDGFYAGDEQSLKKLIIEVRKYQPDIILANAVTDRHPDHGKGAKFASDACFLSGLSKIEVADDEGKMLPAWRPKVVYHYIQDRYITPDFIVDITDFWDRKVECIRAFRSQFFNPDSNEPDTYISSPEFLKFLEARAIEWGHAIGTRYGEGFTKERHLGVKDLKTLI